MKAITIVRNETSLPYARHARTSAKQAKSRAMKIMSFMIFYSSFVDGCCWYAYAFPWKGQD